MGAGGISPRRSLFRISAARETTREFQVRIPVRARRDVHFRNWIGRLVGYETSRGSGMRRFMASPYIYGRPGRERACRHAHICGSRGKGSSLAAALTYKQLPAVESLLALILVLEEPLSLSHSRPRANEFRDIASQRIQIDRRARN